MSIGKRITETFEKLNKKDYESALIPLSIAIGATSSKEYINISRDNKKFKKFILDNLDIIIFTGIGIVLKKGISFKFTDSEIKYPIAKGFATLEEILYHIVRCNLIHEAELKQRIVFKEGNTIALLEEAILLPSELLQGMIFAVIGSIHNSKEHLEEEINVSFGGININLDTLWGKKDNIMNLLETTGPKQ